MKRRLLIVAVFLLAGAVVNVAVAWGIAGISTEYDTVVVFDPLTTDLVFTSFGSELAMRESGPDLTMEEACGWPLLVLHWYQMTSDGPRGAIELGEPRRYSPRNGGSFFLAYPGNRTLPLIPLWPGFAVNTLFYGTVLWLLIPGPFVLRRHIRMKRGQCVKCGYPLGESPVCSECGRPLPSRERTSA